MLWALLPLSVISACQREGLAPSDTTPAAPVTDIGTIASMDGPDLAGQPVQIAAARVQQVVSDEAFWIGPSADLRVLVVAAPGERPVKLQAGQTVSLSGTVERVPSAPEGLRPLKLPERTEDLLRIQIVYIQATRLDRVPASAMQAE